MVTRVKAGIFKPLKRMNCYVTTTSPLLRSHVYALRDLNWKEAMLDEYNTLITNGTWVLVPLPANVNVVRSMWLFKHKFNANGLLSRYKARLVANGRSQQQGIDCDETFSLVVKLATIHTVLSLAVSRDWPIHQLDRSLYGLKQASRAWFQRFASYATRVDFQHSKTDSSLFFFHRGSDIAYLLLYVDDIMFTASSSAFLQRIIAFLHKSKLGLDGDPVSDPTLYRSLIGAFQYLTFTRLDLSYAIQHVCLYMHDPHDPHFTALKRILCYVRGTLDYGLQLHVSSTTQLSAYIDADWVGCPVTLSRSSAEAEYRGVTNVVAETAWIRNLICELHTPLFTATLVYCDNVSVVYMSANPVQRQRTKHIEIDIHFVRDFVASGQVRVLRAPSRFHVSTSRVGTTLPLKRNKESMGESASKKPELFLGMLPKNSPVPPSGPSKRHN
uniref:Ribonuclease H-like domain-containing protein n=1 Tax=Tanacetum cinerariifolium TaxID=118510 RepID=A0A6L2LR73_TANCI|nr:ribonuclease H-like domain-containing protein [Tanacetum cinerariifolium]